MKDNSLSHFGLLVAYVLPGFVGLAGMAPLFPAVAGWLTADGQTASGVGPPVYAILAATAIGSVLSCFRWVLLDHIHLWMGIKRPTWDDSQLDDVLGL